MDGNRSLWLIIIYLVISVYLLPFLPVKANKTEGLAIWATTVSLYQNLSFDITWAESLIGKDEKISRRDERIYSQNPPGLAILGIPVYIITKFITRDPLDLSLGWFLMRFFLCTLPIIFLAYWLFRKDADELSISILLFANPLFIYSLLLTPYVLASCLMYFSFRLIYDPQRIFLRNCFLAGLLSGLALNCTTNSLIFIIILAISLVIVEKKEKMPCILAFSLGLTPFLIILFFHSYVISGSIFTHIFMEFSEFSFKTRNLYDFLLSPQNGLLFYSPILLFSLLLLLISFEKKTARHKVKVALILICLAYFCSKNKQSNFPIQEGFILILPLMMDSFFDGELYDRSNLWLGFLFALSTLFNFLPAITLPIVPPEFKYPHNTLWTKLLTEGSFFTVNSIGLIFGSVINKPFLISISLVLIVFVFHFTWINTRKPSKFLIGAIIGILVVSVYVILPTFDKQNLQKKRQEIKNSFSLSARMINSSLKKCAS